MELPINWPLIRNPINWGIVLLMVLIGGIGVDIILTAVTSKGTTEQ